MASAARHIPSIAVLSLTEAMKSQALVFFLARGAVVFFAAVVAFFLGAAFLLAAFFGGVTT